MDIIDRAQHREQQVRNDAIARARMALAAGPGRMYCLACEDPIPEARRAAMPGVCYCVDCQKELEKTS